MRTQAEPIAIRRHPALNAAPLAMLAGRALATLETCHDGWCQIMVGHTKGWVPADELWGTADAPQCRPRLPRPAP
jgi:SH3-like domain-containing protein